MLHQISESENLRSNDESISPSSTDDFPPLPITSSSTFPLAPSLVFKSRYSHALQTTKLKTFPKVSRTLLKQFRTSPTPPKMFQKHSRPFPKNHTRS